MPKGPMEETMLAPCGMNCMVCYKHCLHPKPCGGCLQSDEGKPEHCRRCQIKDCVRERGLSYCHGCGEYPCRRIKALEKSYRTRYGISLMENSRFAKECGASALLERQKAAFTCPECGGVISLHDAQCSECGRKSG